MAIMEDGQEINAKARHLKIYKKLILNKKIEL